MNCIMCLRKLADHEPADHDYVSEPHARHAQMLFGPKLRFMGIPVGWLWMALARDRNKRCLAGRHVNMAWITRGNPDGEFKGWQACTWCGLIERRLTKD